MHITQRSDRGRLLPIERDWLFNEHMFAALDRQRRRLGMERMRRGDIDGVYFSGLGKLIVTPISSPYAMRCGKSRGLFRGPRTHCRHLHAIGNQVSRERIGDRSESKNAPAQSCHICFPLRQPAPQSPSAGTPFRVPIPQPRVKADRIETVAASREIELQYPALLMPSAFTAAATDPVSAI